MARILAVGGGSGGHVTPVVAVFKELKKAGDHELGFWCDRVFGDRAKKMMGDFDTSLQTKIIASGKLRRYHGESLLSHLAPSILLPNIIDFFKVVFGFFQSLFALIAWRPDVIFMKGGFVCLPVGYAAKLLGIPMVLHDSDAHPGLTNRLLAPFATKIGTGAPLEYYNYPKDKAKYVGIPVSSDFRPYSEAERRELKQRFGFDINKPLVVITGGGLGAVRINNSIAHNLDELLKITSVFLISGNHQYEELKNQLPARDGWRLEAFIHQGMAEVLAAADIVVTRAGATTLLELAALARPTVIVPNGRLTAGHQLKNAKVYQDALAAVIVDEDELAKHPENILKTINHLLKADKIRHELGENFAKFAKPEAAREMAEMVIGVVQDKKAGKAR